MKISEAVTELEKFKESHGDIDIWVLNMDWNSICYPKFVFEPRSESVVVKPEDN